VTSFVLGEDALPLEEPREPGFVGVIIFGGPFRDGTRDDDPGRELAFLAREDGRPADLDEGRGEATLRGDEGRPRDGGRGMRDGDSALRAGDAARGMREGESGRVTRPLGLATGLIMGRRTREFIGPRFGVPEFPLALDVTDSASPFFGLSFRAVGGRGM